MLLDSFHRPLRNLRLSVTDRCNLRCLYCMPEAEYTWLPKHDVLTFEEIDRLVGIFVGLGADKLRLTGGEPLLRTNLPSLVTQLARHASVRDLAMTTNGILLSAFAGPLRDAGLKRVTVSLDTLRRERFVRLTRQDELTRTLSGIDTAARVFPGFKIDTVVIRGVNDDEIAELVAFARERGGEIRFIEYMDVGGATGWTAQQVVSRAEILERIVDAFGPIVPADKEPAAPADRFRLNDGTPFGVIASTTAPFCRDCDRARLTADGMLYTCLYATSGLDLRAALRNGATDDEVRALITDTWTDRIDRGAEARLGVPDRRPLIPVSTLKRDPHLEMHTRGG
ncbi:MAG TPA: GTP 3',8-cyclase MoaA [Vicinamibacterales bacterium]|nr:GTP 3',8-cyclase MoaA [Vicinamibacterales bacterium]